MSTIKPNHVMIDLETRGLEPSSKIISIGAVIFDPRLNVVTDKTFYRELDWEEQTDRTETPSTVEWWDSQSEHARKSLDGMDDLDEALNDLALFVPSSAPVWANGPGFDLTMLEDAYNKAGIDIPWKFWNTRCCRTIRDMFECQRGGFDTDPKPATHNALEDAIRQAKIVNKQWRNLLKEK